MLKEIGDLESWKVLLKLTMRVKNKLQFKVQKIQFSFDAMIVHVHFVHCSDSISIMGLRRRVCCASVLLTFVALASCLDFNINGHGKLVSNRVSDFNTPLMTLHDRLQPRTLRMNRFKSRQNAPFESFNRPEGTESFIVTTKGDNNVLNNNQNQYGRTFGEYGSYRKHTSWQKAVADDRQRQTSASQDFKITFPWLKNHLQRPGLQGFGLNGFWNSYALPEGGPNVPGLGPEVSLVTSRFFMKSANQ